MNSRWTRNLMASLLGLIAFAGAFNVYVSFRASYMMRDVLRVYGIGAANFKWDVWFSGGIALSAVVATIWVLKRKPLAKLAALAVAGACFLWAFALTLLPQAQIDGLFSITIDRIPAACATLVFLTTLELASRMNQSRVQ